MLKPTLRKHRGVFVVVYTQNGKRIRRSLGTSNEAEARRRLAHIELTETVVDRQTQKTVHEIYLLYLRDKELEGKQLRRMKLSWNALAPTFGELFPQYVTKEVQKAYKDNRQAAPGTIHQELNFLRTVLRWGFKHGFLDRPVHIDPGPQPPPRTAYIRKEDFHQLLKGSEAPHIILFMILAVTTGARSNALIDLTWDRVDLDKRIIDLRNPEKSVTAKGRAVVPINDTAYRYLIEAKKGATTRYVLEYANRPIKQVRSSMTVVSRRLGIKVTAHMFRHSAAVWMAEGGTPMSEIAQYLGHANTAITERIYARYSPNYLRNAARHLEL